MMNIRLATLTENTISEFIITSLPGTRLPTSLFRCHSGELLYVFGILQSTTVTPYRDDKDLPFMQQMVDVWTSFARTFNPNPDPAYLRAKGFPDTAAQFEKMSKWEPVTKDNVNWKPLRQLQWDSFMTGFREKEQCGFLGFPLTFYG